MPKDYAGRGRTGKKRSESARPRRTTATARSRSAASPQRVIFHGASFTVGAIVGAAIVILTAYAPQLLLVDDAVEDSLSTSSEQRPAVQFEFPDLLKNNEVAADPEPYAVPESVTRPDRTFRIQAASFRSAGDADRLRADLLLQNLPAATEARQVSGATWYRVVVGPFGKQVEANRAMTTLRAQGLSAMWLNDHN